MERAGNDVVLEIASRLWSGEDVARLSAVNRGLRTLLQGPKSSSIWYRLFVRHVAQDQQAMRPVFDALVAELGTAKSAFVFCFVSLRERLSRRFYSVCAVGLVALCSDADRERLSVFLREGSAADAALGLPHLLASSHGCHTLRAKHTLTFRLLLPEQARLLLDCDVSALVCSADTPAADRETLLRVTQWTFKQPLCAVFFGNANNSALPVEVDYAMEITTPAKLYEVLIQQLPHVAHMPCKSQLLQTTPEGPRFCPLARAALCEALPDINEESGIRRALLRQPGETVDAWLNRAVNAPQSCLKVIRDMGLGAKLILPDAVTKRSSMEEAQLVCKHLMQESRPHMWAPALLFARDWLSYAVATAREELAERVGFVEAVQVVCKRTTTAIERFCATTALDWVRSGDLGKSMEAWHEVVVAAAGSRSHDVRNAALQVMELLEIWNGISMQEWGKLQRGEPIEVLQPLKADIQKAQHVVAAPPPPLAPRNEPLKPLEPTPKKTERREQTLSVAPSSSGSLSSVPSTPLATTTTTTTPTNQAAKPQSIVSKSLLWFLLGLLGAALFSFSLQRLKKRA